MFTVVAAKKKVFSTFCNQVKSKWCNAQKAGVACFFFQKCIKLVSNFLKEVENNFQEDIVPKNVVISQVHLAEWCCVI